MNVPQLRPLGVGEILDAAIKIGSRHFTTLVKIVLVVTLPVEVLRALLLASAFEDPDASAFDENFDTGGSPGAFDAANILGGLIGSLAFLIASAAVLRAVSAAYLGGEVSWRESLSFAFSRLGSLVWLSLLFFLALIPAFLLVLVPGVWLSVSWSLAFVVLLAEGLRGRDALRRSYRLVKGRWWPVFGTLLLAYILQTVVSGVLGFVLGIALFFSDASALSFLVATLILGVIGSALTTPFLSAVFVLVYFDLRVRKEGFDLQLLAAAMGAVDPVTGAPLTPPASAPGTWGDPPGPSWSTPPPPSWGPPGQPDPSGAPRTPGPPSSWPPPEPDNGSGWS